MKLTITASLVALGFGLASAASAQTTPPVADPAADPARSAEAAAQQANQGETQAGTLTDIVVTAQRRAERLQDTPVSVSAFTSDMLDERQIERTEDLAASVPSLYINTVSASPSALVVFLRGAGEQVGGLATSESPVGIYIDDIYFARLANANLDLADVERVEVLRGPQGTLYGRNTMTGALKIVTHRPTDELWIRADASYGRFDRLRLRGAVAGPLGGEIGGLVSGYFTHGNGWFDNIGPDPKRGDRRSYGGRVSLATIGTGALSGRISAFYGNDRNDGITPVPVNPNPPFESLTGKFRTTRSPIPAYGRNKQWGVIGDLSIDLGAVTVKSLTGYIDTSDRWGLDFSGGFRNAAGNVVAGFFRRSETRQDQFSQELQLQGKGFGDRLKWILGAYYFTESAEQSLADSFGTGVFGPFPVNLLPSSFSLDTKSYAAFGQADFEVSPGLTLSLGGRYTEEKKDFRGFIQNGLGFPPAYAPETIRSLDDNEFTPRIGVDYKINRDVLLYANVSKGFKAGGFNGLAVANPAIFGSPYGAESVWAYEAGVKSELLERRLRLNVAYFYNDLRDIQQNVVVGGGSTRTENAANASLQGIELESTAVITDALSIFGHLSLLWDDYKKLSPNSQAALAGAERLPLVSKLQSQIGFNYRQPIAASGAILLNGDWSHRSTRFSEAANQPIGKIGPVDRVNASIGYETEDRRWQISLSGRNLLGDKDYYSGLSLIPGVIAVKFFEEPMTWMATLRYRLN
jgi:iron complex outermembrane receptor protein